MGLPAADLSDNMERATLRTNNLKSSKMRHTRANRLVQMSLVAAFVVGILISAPAFAQDRDTVSADDAGQRSRSNPVTGSQGKAGQSSSGHLATNRTSGPPPGDAPSTEGWLHRKIVRYNRLMGRQEGLTIIANVLELTLITVGGCCLALGIVRVVSSKSKQATDLSPV